MTCEQMLTALEAAILAPSPHNTQPWRFEVTDDQVDLFLDESRILAVADPQGREARMSCAAALFNFRMSLRAQGAPVRVKLLPDPAQPALLARVRIGGRQAVTSDERLLAEAIPRRRVLLAATASEVSASFLSAAVELPSSRASLHALLDSEGYPQVVLRLGYGYPAPRTKRRPAKEISTCVDPNVVGQY